MRRIKIWPSTKKRFTTESGAKYTLDMQEMTWAREGGTQTLRTDEGRLFAWPEVKIGHCVHMFGPAIDKNADFRWLHTTPVVSIEEIGA